jgi:multidrug efflux pump subunit AcrB
MLNVQAKMPYGSSLEQMDEMIRSMEEYLSKVTGVDQYRSSVQAGSATISVSFLEEYEFTGLPTPCSQNSLTRPGPWMVRTGVYQA